MLSATIHAGWIGRAIDAIDGTIGFAERPSDRNLVENVRARGFEDEESGNWLGLYTPIRHGIPGNIILHGENLAAFARSAMAELAAKGCPRHSRGEIPSLIIFGTYAHEQFHFICDAARRSGASAQPFDRCREEGLATAWSRMCMRSLGEGLECCDETIAWKFDLITAPGYKDWRNYPSPESLRRAVDEYVGLWSLKWPDWIPGRRAAAWCNYWIGGLPVKPCSEPAHGARGGPRFFNRDLHRTVLAGT
jgi:hypothetical protein